MRPFVLVATFAPAIATIAAPHARAQTTTGAPAPAPAPATETPGAGTDDAEYQQKVADAIAEYERGNWAEARALFLQAHEQSPSARTFRTLGMTAFELRDYVGALRELSAALADPRRPLDDRLRADVQALLERTGAFVGRFRTALDPKDANLSVDDRPAVFEADGSLLLGLGEHTLRATADGHTPLQRALRVSGREDAALELRLEPVEARPPLVAPERVTSPPVINATETPPADARGGRTLTWVAAAGAVAFAGAAAGLWVAAGDELDDLERRCNAMPERRCEHDEVDVSTLDTLDTLTTISVVTAAVSATAAITLYFVEGTRSEARTAVSFERGGPRLAYRF